MSDVGELGIYWSFFVGLYEIWNIRILLEIWKLSLFCYSVSFEININWNGSIELASAVFTEFYCVQVIVFGLYVLYVFTSHAGASSSPPTSAGSGAFFIITEFVAFEAVLIRKEAIRTPGLLFATQVMLITAPMPTAVTANPPPTRAPFATQATAFILFRLRAGALFSVMLVSSVVFHVRRSSELRWDFYIWRLQEVEAQSVEWLQNLQAFGVVPQCCRHSFQQLNLWNVVELAHGRLVVAFQGFLLEDFILGCLRYVLHIGSQRLWVSWNIIGDIKYWRAISEEHTDTCVETWLLILYNNYTLLNEMMWTAGIQMKCVCDHRSESQFKQLRK